MTDNNTPTINNHDHERTRAEWHQVEHELLDFYVKIMPMLMNAERCSIFVIEKARDGVWLRAGTGLNVREIELKAEQDSILTEAIRSGEAIYRSGLQEENGLHKEVDEATGFETRDIICVPIRSVDGSRITGAVQVLNKKDGQPYSDDERELLEEMLNYLELAIENIYVQQRTSGTLGKIYKLLSRLGIGLVFAFIVILGFFALYWAGLFLIG